MTDRVRLPKRLSHTDIYKSSWVRLAVERVRFPGGRIIPRHHVITFPNPAVAALVENDRGDLLFVKAYRYISRSVQWELPAGRMEKGETPVVAAKREVLEETGYRTTAARWLYKFQPVNGSVRLTFHLVGCRALRQVGAFDPNEIQQVRWFSAKEIRALLQRHEIKDGLTLAGLFFAKNSALFSPRR